MHLHGDFHSPRGLSSSPSDAKQIQQRTSSSSSIGDARAVDDVRGVKGISVLSESEARTSAELVCAGDVVARALGLCCRVAAAGVCEVFDIVRGRA